MFDPGFAETGTRQTRDYEVCSPIPGVFYGYLPILSIGLVCLYSRPVDPRLTGLKTLYQQTLHPYICPNCSSHRTFLNPRVNPIPQCPDCAFNLVPHIVHQPGQKELDKDATFQYTVTPEIAIDVIDTIPDDSFHWPAISWKQVEYYADILASGGWDNYEQHWHPIRFNTEGNILTGVQRLLAVFLSNIPMDVWIVDHSELWFRHTRYIGPPSDVIHRQLDAVEVQE